MTFLELVQRLATETGTELESKITSVATPPTTTYGETTEHRSRLVRWIKQAWREIQDDQDQWNFMVRTHVMPLAEGQVKYNIKRLVDENLPVDYAEYTYERIVPFVAPRDHRYIWIIRPESTRGICYYVPPERFFGYLDRPNNQSVHRVRGFPSRYSFDRDGCIVFNAAPDRDDYFIEFEYRVAEHELVNDDDEPRGLPKKFHELIVYQAMEYYAMFDESQFQLQRATKLRRDKMNKLRLEQLREYSMAGTFT